ncbi:DUF397 domain-containing protein [Actinomadura graeca]|uniref:DUF397 domain-containing protein n=1 Tax=Actinomadura graeca TaxID=2750812 RepID=A0ABX8QV43_9ACTN|nr:DUF397 domain-containing protein [Actinomadura graeca]QXJ22686.1 DUF397 domain-containing protein [Actinomadura graeca]
MTTWRTSSHSDETGGHCVEVAQLPDTLLVRDSKAPDDDRLTLTPSAFATLLTRVKHDEANL